MMGPARGRPSEALEFEGRSGPQRAPCVQPSHEGSASSFYTATGGQPGLTQRGGS